MTLYINNRGEIKSVNAPIEGLTEIVLADTEKAFEGWNDEVICCYRVGVIPETVTNIIDTITETYEDLDGNTQTVTKDITETVPTGKYLVSMITPYVDTRVIEHYARLANGISENTENIMTNSECLDEVAEIISEYDQADVTTSECLDETAECISELYELIDSLQAQIDTLNK